MAFNTHLGQFEYLVMLFGLTVFQAIVNDILRDFINHFVFVYLDDILIFSRSVVEHERHVKLVLQRLLENRLFVEAEKGEFHVNTASFLSSIIKQENLRPEKSKLSWSGPHHQTANSFNDSWGLQMSIVASFTTSVKLSHLTSPKVLFQWGQAAHEVFAHVKQPFALVPILTQLDRT